MSQRRISLGPSGQALLIASEDNDEIRLIIKSLEEGIGIVIGEEFVRVQSQLLSSFKGFTSDDCTCSISHTILSICCQGDKSQAFSPGQRSDSTRRNVPDLPLKRTAATQPLCISISRREIRKFRGHA